MLLAVVLNIIQPDVFGTIMTTAKKWVLNYFGWLFTVVALASMVICAVIGFLPFGRTRLGGRHAEPIMSRWNWFAITLCTTVAIGILFWSTAEPLAHYFHPPESVGIAPESPEAFQFSIAILYLHWTFLPYSIYCAASLMFGFAYYNMRGHYSLGATLEPLIGSEYSNRIGPVIDAICLYSLVAGMAAALGVGILAIAGGLNQLFGLPSNQWVWLVIALAIVISFITSSASGLLKGIRILSDINAKGLFLLAIIVFAVGPVSLICTTGIAAVGDFIRWFPHLAIVEGLAPKDEWPRNWSIFYWAVWIAWTPVTACFLGRIAYGRTVREFLIFNLVLPALFCMVWMAIFGVTTLNTEQQMGGLREMIDNQENEKITNAVLAALPLGSMMVIYYLLSAFVCFVTSADSNTTAMASLSEEGITQEDSEGDARVKVVWGLLVGATAWTIISYAQVDGVRTMSQLGGLPAAILLVFVLAALCRVAISPQRFDRSDETMVATTRSTDTPKK